MLVRLADLGADDFFDDCIIGTGPAGISCALALIPSGRRILLLEGGDRDISAESQALYRGTVIGDPYYELEEARLRYFGGTSNHWDGICRTLEALDFEPRSASSLAVWPIAKTDLDPYLEQASSILQVPAIEQDRAIDTDLRRVYFVNSPPVRFREIYFDELTARANLFVCLNANLLCFETDGAAVTAARVAGFDGRQMLLHAHRYVLATGGIENSRILLWSNVQSNGALVKQAATLGRYWMEHLYLSLGEAIIFDDKLQKGGLSNRFYAFSKAIMDRERMFACALKTRPQSQEGLTRSLADLACAAPNWAKRVMDSVGLAQLCAVELRAQSEQEPSADNRIELGEETDALGIPRVNLYWRRTAMDLHTIRATARLFAEYLAEADVGRARLNQWLLEDGGLETMPKTNHGRHHMGGTRMAQTPAEGIVDRNCKVFGQENLYVAGSSVFPTGGYCNPTLSIVQLALRLGDHLRSVA